MNRSPHKYRPDIDGLRAVAVLSVFLHHLSPLMVPGGFIGVDVFFVISGYLITSQISEEIRGGTFSIRQFYQRRINRITPALVTVVSASMVTGVILLSPADLVLLTKSAVYSIFRTSNLFFGANTATISPPIQPRSLLGERILSPGVGLINTTRQVKD